jgi:hypothetical protein
MTFKILYCFVHGKRTKAEAFKAWYREQHVDVHGACAKPARQFLNQWKGAWQPFTRSCVIPEAGQRKLADNIETLALVFPCKEILDSKVGIT